MTRGEFREHHTLFISRSESALTERLSPDSAAASFGFRDVTRSSPQFNRTAPLPFSPWLPVQVPGAASS